MIIIILMTTITFYCNEPRLQFVRRWNKIQFTCNSKHLISRHDDKLLLARYRKINRIVHRFLSLLSPVERASAVMRFFDKATCWCQTLKVLNARKFKSARKMRETISYLPLSLHKYKRSYLLNKCIISVVSHSRKAPNLMTNLDARSCRFT